MRAGQSMEDEEQYFSPGELRVIFREAPRIFSSLLSGVCRQCIHTVLASYTAVAGTDVCDEVGTSSAQFFEHYGLPKVADTLNNARTHLYKSLEPVAVWNMTYHTHTIVLRMCPSIT